MGVNNRIPQRVAGKYLSNSLLLIEPEYLVIRFIKYYGQKVQAEFGLNGRRYDLRVTDPEIERHWSKMKNAERQVSEARLCVSLGENHDGFVYKLVAAVITSKTTQQKR